MKNILTIIALFIAAISSAQSPGLFNYQGLARGADQEIIKESEISLRLSILEDTDNGNLVFSETHLIETSASGIFSLKIGNGQNATGDLSQVGWSQNLHFLKVEMDVNGGTNFDFIGTSQLVSVPYALHAETVTDKDDADADPQNEIQNISFNVATNKLTLSNGGEVDLSSLDNDGGGTGSGTDDQLLSFSGNVLSIEDGNSVDLSSLQDGVEDADADATNELQDLSLQGKTLLLSRTNSSIDLSILQDGVDDADADASNELQDLSLQGNTLTLSKTNSSVNLSSLQSPWKQVGQTDIIEYKSTTPLARVTDDTKTMNMSPEMINLQDETDCRTYLTNGALLINQETMISDDLTLIAYASGLNKDSVYFEDYVSDGGAYNRSSLSRDKVGFEAQQSGQTWTSHVDAVQMDMRMNDTEAWGNYDSYGLTAITSAQSLEGQSEVDLKATLGLYISKLDNGVNNATLATDQDISFGTGIGAGLMDEVHTNLNKHQLVFDSYVDNGLQSGKSIYGRDYMLQEYSAGPQTNRNYTNVFGISYENSIDGNSNRMDLNDASLEFLNPNFGHRWTHLGLDSLTLQGNIGLLYPETATLKRSHLFFESLDFQSTYDSYGINIKQALSDVDVFERIKLIPDELSMFNAAKWQTVQLGTNMDNGYGEITLFGNGAVPHTYLGGLDLGGSILEMNYGDQTRIGAWAFQDYGIMNTMGNNGSQNTFVGVARNHDDTNFGGLGVMDDIGFVKAGMEVDESGFGMVYTNGCLKVLDADEEEVSCSDWFGYRLNRQDGSNILSFGRNFLSDDTGFYIASGANSNLNFLAAANENYDGGTNYGFMAVHDASGNEKAGMYATTGGRGFVFADGLYVGEKPTNISPYPLKVIQQPSYGFDLMRSDMSTHWELYVSVDKNLTLYKDNSSLGFFDDVTGAYTTFSDRRLKTNIRSMSGVLNKVKSLEPSQYAYLRNNPEEKETFGFIAQDVQKLFPELVTSNTDKNGEVMLAVDYSGFGVLAIKAIQEQQVTIDQQTEEIDALKSRLERIEKLLKE